jgi:hypothetical protein
MIRAVYSLASSRWEQYKIFEGTYKSLETFHYRDGRGDQVSCDRAACLYYETVEYMNTECAATWEE